VSSWDVPWCLGRDFVASRVGTWVVSYRVRVRVDIKWIEYPKLEPDLFIKRVDKAEPKPLNK